MRRIINFISGFVLGAGIGATLVLITTPKSGSSFQDDLRTEKDRLLAEGKKAYEAKRSELEVRVATLRAGEA